MQPIAVFKRGEVVLTAKGYKAADTPQVAAELHAHGRQTFAGLPFQAKRPSSTTKFSTTKMNRNIVR